MLLQGSQVNKSLPAPNTLELGFPGVHTLVLGQVLALLEALITAGTLKRFLSGVNAAMALQLGGVLETLFTVGAFQGLLTSWVTAVLNKL